MKKYLKMISPFNNESEMPKILYVIKKVIAFILIYIVASLLGEAIVIALHFAFGLNPLKGEMLSVQSMLLLKYYGYIVFLVLALLYCKFIEKRTIKSMGFNGKVYEFFTGMGIALVLVIGSVALIMSLGQIKYNGIGEDYNLLIIAAFFGAFIIQGTMEETLSRGFLMTSLTQKLNIPISITISALIFAIPHFSTLFANGYSYALIGLINLILISVIFSLLMIKRKNIWISSGLHSFWNFLLFNIMGINLSGTDTEQTALLEFQITKKNILNGGDYGMEASIITMLVLGVFAIILIMHNSKKIQVHSVFSE